MAGSPSLSTQPGMTPCFGLAIWAAISGSLSP
jgi:hypothetical protein